MQIAGSRKKVTPTQHRKQKFETYWPRKEHYISQQKQKRTGLEEDEAGNNTFI